MKALKLFLSVLSMWLVTISIVSCSKDKAAAESPIADVTTDFRASVPPKDDTISYDATDTTRGSWTSGTMPDGTYNKDSFVAFTNRSYDGEGFETYGFVHPSSSQYPWLGQDCGIPRSDTLQPAIRRWTSKFDGVIRIVGEVGMDTSHQTLGGTGTRVTLYVDGEAIYTKDLDGDDDTQFSFTEEDVTVSEGSVVDLAVEAIDDSSRIANFTAKFYLVSEE